MTEYQMYGINLSKGQIQKIKTGAKNHREVKIRLSKNNLQGNHKVPLTQRQINKIQKSKTGIDLELSVSALKHLVKTGGILPLLALLPLIFGGIGAAGTVASVVSNAVTGAKNAQAAVAAQAEMERHNRELEAQLKAGSGVVSNVIGNVPIIGSFLAPILERFGLGIKDQNRLMKGGCVCLNKVGKGLYLRPYGEVFFRPSRGRSFFSPAPKLMNFKEFI